MIDRRKKLDRQVINYIKTYMESQIDKNLDRYNFLESLRHVSCQNQERVIQIIVEIPLMFTVVENFIGAPKSTK